LIIVLIKWNNYLTMENNYINYCYYSDLPSPMAYMELEEELSPVLTKNNHDQLVEIAGEYQVAVEANDVQLLRNETEVNVIMNKEQKYSRYQRYRTCFGNSATKNTFKRTFGIHRFKSNFQSSFSQKISKRK